MKTNRYARRLLKLRNAAGLATLLMLASAEFWMVCHLGHECGQRAPRTAVQMPAVGDWFASR